MFKCLIFLLGLFLAVDAQLITCNDAYVVDQILNNLTGKCNSNEKNSFVKNSFNIFTKLGMIENGKLKTPFDEEFSKHSVKNKITLPQYCGLIVDKLLSKLDICLHYSNNRKFSVCDIDKCSQDVIGIHDKIIECLQVKKIKPKQFPDEKVSCDNTTYFNEHIDYYKCNFEALNLIDHSIINETTVHNAIENHEIIRPQAHRKMLKCAKEQKINGNDMWQFYHCFECPQKYNLTSK